MVAAAVLYVNDLARMRTFYERCFGLSVVASDGNGYCVLASEQWDLSLVSIPEAVAATVVITDPPGRREEAPIKLAFEVASIDAVAAVVGDVGGRMDPIDSAWDFRGHRHLDCLDPEGNVVQLRQRAHGPGIGP